MSHRINARLDDDLVAKLDVLRASSGASTTDVLREAIERYHASVEAETGSHARDAFAAAGFVGCAEGPRDLASRTKHYALEALHAKVARDGAKPSYRKSRGKSSR